ncbi:MAG: c-type cytochrome [Anaerolineales bacterium]|jgi:mono/diheme cytochrome c family protein
MPSKPKTLILLVGLVGLLAACGGGATNLTPTSSPTLLASSPTLTSTGMPPTVEASPTVAQTETRNEEAVEQQSIAGQKVYQDNCSGCHGSHLQGVSAPALTQTDLPVFGTAEALLQFISGQMPQGSPGSLTHQQYLDVAAYILHYNGLIPPTEPLRDENAASLALKVSSQAKTATPAATASAQQTVLVEAAEVPTLGTFLTDNKGFTLYTYQQDQPGISKCSGNCAAIFPPLTVPQDLQPAVAPGIPGKLGVIERAGGAYQITYSSPPKFNQVPLYTYYGDTEPGQTNGEAFQDQWEIISVSLSTAQAAPGTTPTSAVSAQGNAALGAPTYLENCTPCHGIEGQGVDAPALRNNPFVRSAGDQAVHETIADGRPDTEMPAWLQAKGGPLSDQQIANVVAYLHTLQGVSQLPTATPMPPEPTETPLPPGAPTLEPARPSEPGGPGPAAALTGNITNGEPDFGLFCAKCHGPEGVQGIPNPGSDDGSVPPLNPIDPTIANQNPQIFTTNVDLFIEHGSVPEGPSPLILMPSFGDSKMLSDQQIADLIAYVMYLNGVSNPK